MAQKIITLFIDDLDGASDESIRPRKYFDPETGEPLEAEFSDANWDKFLKANRPYTSVARHGSHTPKASKTQGSRRVDTTKIRDWCHENGYDVKNRGRVPADLVAKYQAATGK